MLRRCKENVPPRSAQRTQSDINSTRSIGCLRDFLGERMLKPGGSSVFQVSGQSILEHQ
jgi:hypothetical protein